MAWYPLVRDVGAEMLRWSGWSDPRRRLHGKLSIATFHRVLSASETEEYPLAGLAVTPEQLSSILEALARHFSCMPLTEAATRWLANADESPPLLALTFDDGQLDNMTRALPVLDAHGLRATFFVVSNAAATRRSLWQDRVSFALSRAVARDAAGARALVRALSPEADARDPVQVVELAKRRFHSMTEREAWVERVERAAGGAWRPPWDGMLGFEDLRVLHEAGHEIGSHSFSHPLLPQCDDRELEREVHESRRQLERELGAPISSFCYPNGSWNARTLEAVRKAGYLRAVTTDHGWNGQNSEPFSLRRCDLSYVHCVDRRGRFSEDRLLWRLGRGGE